MNKFYLNNYKNKFTIISDEPDEAVGLITKEEAISQAQERKAEAQYYGVPAYIGEDKELNKIYENL